MEGHLNNFLLQHQQILVLVHNSTTSSCEFLCGQSLTVEDIEAFVPRLFSSTHIEALVHGNVTEKQATKIVQLVEDK